MPELRWPKPQTSYLCNLKLIMRMLSEQQIGCLASVSVAGVMDYSALSL